MKKPSYKTRDKLIKTIQQKINNQNKNNEKNDKKVIYFVRKYNHLYDNTKYFYDKIQKTMTEIPTNNHKNFEVALAYKMGRKIKNIIATSS